MECSFGVALFLSFVVFWYDVLFWFFFFSVSFFFPSSHPTPAPNIIVKGEDREERDYGTTHTASLLNPIEIYNYDRNVNISELTFGGLIDDNDLTMWTETFLQGE